MSIVLSWPIVPRFFSERILYGWVSIEGGWPTQRLILLITDQLYCRVATLWVPILCAAKGGRGYVSCGPR